MTISIYTDGSSNGKSGSPIGWAYVIVMDGKPLVSEYGHQMVGSNNIAELTAAINGIESWLSIQHSHSDYGIVELVSDSKYTLGMCSGLHKPTKNVELCKRLALLRTQIDQLRWVPGHSKEESEDSIWNNRVDSLSKLGRRIANGLKAGEETA